MSDQYLTKTIQPFRYYVGERPLHNAVREIGALINKENQTYEVTRIEPNGLCFGVHTEYLEHQRRFFREYPPPTR
jgi:hypothetical protein